jgi:hypothetical protein
MNTPKLLISAVDKAGLLECADRKRIIVEIEALAADFNDEEMKRLVSFALALSTQRIL